MQISRKATTIALMLLLAFAGTLTLLPFANAHLPPWQIKVYEYVSVSPKVIGVNQRMILVAWSNQLPVGTGGQFGYRYQHWIDIMKPDGTNDTIGPIKSDPVGSCWVYYTPTQLGTYYAVARLPPQSWDGLHNNAANAAGTMSTNVNVNDTYYADPSAPDSFEVVQQQMQPFPETPLPTTLWTRPIYGTARDWWSVAAMWVGTWANMISSRYSQYSDMPGSAHILWSRPTWLGGVMGGPVGAASGIQREYYTGQSYESYGGPTLCVDGKITYSVGQPPVQGWYVVDLYTGKTIYYENNTDGHHAMPSMGQVLNIDNPNQHGGFAYFWRTSGVALEDNRTTSAGTVYEMLDAYTGNVIVRIANWSRYGGTQFMDNIGSICYVSITNRGNATNPNYRLLIWNSTWAIINGTTATNTPATLYWSYKQSPVGNTHGAGRPLGVGYDGDNGYILNVSIPVWSNPTIRDIHYGVTDDDCFIVGGSSGSNNASAGGATVLGDMWKLFIGNSNAGTLAWNFTFTPPDNQGGNRSIAQGDVDSTAGVFYYSCTQQTKWFAFSLDQAKTGQPQGTELWEHQVEQFEYYGMSNTAVFDTLYTYGYGGVLHAFNATTGETEWNWSAPYVGLDETPYEHTPLSLGVIAGTPPDMVMYTSEHSPTMPLRRDAKLYCIDCTTGQLIWAEQCYPSSAPIIADGRIIVMDMFDDAIYCYGQGTSATTVSAPQTSPPLGENVTIVGTVTDNDNTGRLNTNAAGTVGWGWATSGVSGDYDWVLKGTPAISDADQEAWMDYMFHQRPFPSNAKGVPVTLDAIDPNGNYVHIGDVTSDNTGHFGFSWLPDVPGVYQVIATFAGSAAYGSSFSDTYMTVGPAPTVITPTTQVVQLPPYDLYIIGATVAMLIAIALVGLLILRKK